MKIKAASLAILSMLLTAPAFAGGVTGGVRNEWGTNHSTTTTVRNLVVAGTSSIDFSKIQNVKFCGETFSNKAFIDLTATDFKAGLEDYGVYADGSLTLSTGYTESASAIFGTESTSLKQSEREVYAGTEKTETSETANSKYHEASSFGQSVF